MTIAEVKKQIERLGREEQDELLTWILQRRRLCDAAFVEKTRRRLENTGAWVNLDDARERLGRHGGGA